MIKFFRKIRQKLLSENKFSKYLIYAIGEIALVVIGILIALQVNNWNESRKDNLREKAILIQLEKEYNANLKQLEAKMEMRSSVISSGLSILKYMSNPALNIPRDSLLFYLSRINNDATFDPIQNDLISSGNIRLIRNEKLRNLLSNWTSDLLALQEQEEMTQMMVHEIMRPMFDEIGITRDILNIGSKIGGKVNWLLDASSDKYIEFGNSLISISIQDILTHRKLEGLVANAVNMNSNGNFESIAIKSRIIDILELIETELKK